MKTSGHILLTHDGLEIANIDTSKRDKVMDEFYRMETEASRDGDAFYILRDTITQPFSYGSFYPGPSTMAWAEFHKKFQDISLNTFRLLIAPKKDRKPQTIDTLQEFEAKDHRTLGGFDIQNKPEGYIYDKSTRNQWHVAWFSQHQDKIPWIAGNSLFPQPNMITDILERELNRHKDELETRRIPLPEKAKDIVSVFHKEVMGHKGLQKKAYATEIGTEICLSNYYTEEKELSRMESNAAGTDRIIFRMVLPNGKDQFLSIDFAHGMFELMDWTGYHKGEYRFDGSLNADAEPEDHSLKCLQQWRKNMQHQ